MQGRIQLLKPQQLADFRFWPYFSIIRRGFRLRLDTKLTIQSSWPLLRLSRFESITQKGYKPEVLMLTFVDMLQGSWAEWTVLSQYHFRIDYRQGKANGDADALSCFAQSQVFWAWLTVMLKSPQQARRGLARVFLTVSLITQILNRLPSFVEYRPPFRPQPFRCFFYFGSKPDTSAPSPPVRCNVTLQAELANNKP